MNIQDYLVVDYELSGIEPSELEVRLLTEIVEIEENPYHYPIPGDKGVRHFKLLIYPEERWIEDGECSDWKKIKDWHGFEPTPLFFHYSTYGVPDIFQFTEHIHRECSAALFATYNPKNRSIFKLHQRGIEMNDVFVYLKLKHKNYEDTKSFIKDYWYWHDCLYQTQKWYHYLLGDISRKIAWDRWDYPVGWKMIEFISPDAYPSEIEAIRKELIG